MKIGDLVKLKSAPGQMSSGSTGVIIELFGKKCWRVQDRGPMVDWSKIDPEPHAKVMINEDVLSFLVEDLELA